MTVQVYSVVVIGLNVYVCVYRILVKKQIIRNQYNKIPQLSSSQDDKYLRMEQNISTDFVFLNSKKNKTN